MSVRLGLLALLDDADMYGYQLKSAFEARTGGVWPLNIGQVYTTLARLERDGLVATSTRDGNGEGGGDGGEGGRTADDRQHVYSITAAGRRELADWFAESPAEGPPPRDELIAKVLLAAAGGSERALGVVTAQRTALFAALQARRRALRAARAAENGGGNGHGAGDGEPEAEGEAGGDEALAAALVQDALVIRAESELRWLDQCEARLLSRRSAGASTRRST
ncbi:MAG TPA: PadR family transcriptional regulator [Acidimicrobiales bacterium]|nr:PadR family transcriptional regulator [Acidimicrobiales bacterium]